MIAEDPDFAEIAATIRKNIVHQGFMTLVGAEVAELSRGGCTLAVDRRPELLQQNGFFHGASRLSWSIMPPRSLPRHRAGRGP